MPTCATILPVISADYCNPNINYARINQIFFTRLEDTITSPLNLANFVSRLDNTTALAAPGTKAKIRYLNGIGSLAAPSVNELDGSLGRKYKSKADFTIEFDVDDTSQSNYDFMKAISAQGGQTYACWWEAGGLLFGGLTGVPATLYASYEIVAGDKDIQKMKVSLKWSAVSLPDRQAYPTA
jgi:hypothetical protein